MPTDSITAQKFPAAPTSELAAASSSFAKNKKKEIDDDLAELEAWAN